MWKYIAATVLVFTTATATFADDKSYKEGPVTEVSYVRVKDGKFLDYMDTVGTLYKKHMEAYKKAGLVLDYHIYQATPHAPSDANIILTVTYANYAALDKTADFDAIDVKLEGSLRAAEKGFAERGSLREVLGSDLIQELILK